MGLILRVGLETLRETRAAERKTARRMVCDTSVRAMARDPPQVKDLSGSHRLR